jgi:uncharacterized protein (DUF58 family)
MQQIMAYETDLLEYGDIFAGSTEIARKVAGLKEEALAELRRHGVLVLDVAPGQAAQAVVRQYAALKRRAAL